MAHNFYLDFLLPPFDEAALFVDIEYPDYFAQIRAWDRATEELFPTEVCKTLSSAQIKLNPLAVPGVNLQKRTVDDVADRLTVILVREVEDDYQVQPGDAEFWFRKAVKAANYILAHLRVSTGVARITLIPQYWKPGTGTPGVQIPHTVIWVNADTQEAVPFVEGLNGYGSSGAIKVPETGLAVWERFAASVGPGNDPILAESLLMDAEESAIRIGLRESVLCTASACESEAALYASNQVKISKSQLARIVKADASFAERYYDLLPLAVAGKSFQSEAPDAFEDIKSAYQERNKLMHTGKFSTAITSLTEEEQFATIYRWILSARRATRWIRSL
ncbi:hypothetical protein AB0M43_38015 [Longispora sp. NPDC051575]|uniref:hypothetical protein n=1 Tax=Longispora sp. NPDC051575 TaxID=3154943 RepID=UPI0034378D28